LSLPFALPGILPILAAITQWIQQRMMTPPTDDPQQKMQNQMMQFMPLMMLWFGLSFQSSLALYWVTQNVFGIVQQYFSTGWGSLLPIRNAPETGSAPGVAAGRQITGAARAATAPAGRLPAPTERQNGRERRDGRAGGSGGASGAGGGSSRARREGKRSSGKR